MHNERFGHSSSTWSQIFFTVFFCSINQERAVQGSSMKTGITILNGKLFLAIGGGPYMTPASAERTVDQYLTGYSQPA